MPRVERWTRLREAIRDEPLPCAFVDLDAFDENVERRLRPIRAGGKTLRPATKSIRVPSLIRRFAAAPGVRGLMTYSARETLFLAEEGFEDLLCAYPTVQRSDVDALAAAAKRTTIRVVCDDVAHLEALDAAAERAGTVVGAMVEIDMSYRPIERVHLGVRRSPLRTAEDARTFAERATGFRHLRFDGVDVTGASPETLVRLSNGRVELRPIAGTRPRGADPDDDERLAAELTADPKERAEHFMLIDLGRNDVGRVAEIGSVRVTEQLVIERYSHVMHLVSHVVGKLAKGRSWLDVLRAAFPAGTLSRAPKIRAMEIIDELEPHQRGIYGGAVGYVSYTGNLDLAIAIRTLVSHHDTLYVQAGAGLVADSVPEREYEETVNKARAVLNAVEMAERGL
jgi:hypothetical protein